MTETSNSRIKQNLKNTEDVIEYPNQTATAFLLQLMHVKLHFALI